jgi:hypothetical protein
MIALYGSTLMVVNDLAGFPPHFPHFTRGQAGKIAKISPGYPAPFFGPESGICADAPFNGLSALQS